MQKWRYRGLNPGHDISPNNFDIFSVELGLLDITIIIIRKKIKFLDLLNN